MISFLYYSTSSGINNNSFNSGTEFDWANFWLTLFICCLIFIVLFYFLYHFFIWYLSKFLSKLKYKTILEYDYLVSTKGRPDKYSYSNVYQVNNVTFSNSSSNSNST